MLYADRAVQFDAHSPEAQLALGNAKLTAGNAAGLNDGATGCLLAAEDVARELGLTIGMRLVGFGFAGVEPEVMGGGPIPAAAQMWLTLAA